MLGNLIFCLNATVPIFLMMVFGYIFRRAGVFDENFVKRMNSFVFKFTLPAMLFEDLAVQDFFAMWDGRYVVFCFTVTLVCIIAAVLISHLFDRTVRGEFCQAAYRSSAAILGIGFIHNIYGSSGIAPLMILASVPLYNVIAVTLLTVYSPDNGRFDGAVIVKSLKGIAGNPIILSIFVGMLWSLLKLPHPPIVQKTLNYMANLTTPLGLMALGGSFNIARAGSKMKPAVTAAVLKLVVWAAIFLPAAVALGFREDKIIAILIMLASPTTVTSFVMARNMGHEGTVSSCAVMLTTLFSAFTLTGWLYILKTLGLV